MQTFPHLYIIIIIIIIFFFYFILFYTKTRCIQNWKEIS